MKELKQVNIQLTPDLQTAVADLMKKEDRSAAYIARQLIAEALDIRARVRENEERT